MDRIGEAVERAPAQSAIRTEQLLARAPRDRIAPGGESEACRVGRQPVAEIAQRGEVRVARRLVQDKADHGGGVGARVADISTKRLQPRRCGCVLAQPVRQGDCDRLVAAIGQRRERGQGVGGAATQQAGAAAAGLERVDQIRQRAAVGVAFAGPSLRVDRRLDEERERRRQSLAASASAAATIAGSLDGGGKAMAS